MPYQVTLKQGINGSHNIVVKATQIKYTVDFVEFLNDSDEKVAVVPASNILYIKKVDNDS